MTASTPKLKMTQEQFDAMHAALDKVRSTSKTVTVDKASLAAILRDYVEMLAALRIIF